MTHYAYIHGFASSARSNKGVALAAHVRRAHGLELALPDLNVPSFAELTITGGLSVMDAMGPGPWGFVGSSMGGYQAALWAARHPERVARLVLLCPGFALAERWPDMLNARNMARWERDGALPIPDATGTPTPVHWGFIEDARTLEPWPVVPCPTVIVHGLRDTVVPIEGSRRYAAEHADRVTLVEVDDDHRLGSSLDTICELVDAMIEATSSAQGVGGGQ